jgi:hypothetical protein
LEELLSRAAVETSHNTNLYKDGLKYFNGVGGENPSRLYLPDSAGLDK